MPHRRPPLKYEKLDPSRCRRESFDHRESVVGGGLLHYGKPKMTTQPPAARDFLPVLTAGMSLALIRRR
jgi:hypothetical protein